MTKLRIKMKLKELSKSTPFGIVILVTILFANTDFQSVKAQKSQRFFTFKPITEIEFRKALKNNYNAPFETKIVDSTKLEKAYKSIEKTLNEDEIELAKSDSCLSLKCIADFQAYYPTLNLYLFNIFNLPSYNAGFVFANNNEMTSDYQRFRRAYGVMSKDGLWAGLALKDCDNFLQMEICKTSKLGDWSLFKFDFKTIDINDAEETTMFWADKNTIYIASHEYEQLNEKDLFKFYAIKFEY